MDKNCGGVKVTYIETQFVTSDAAGFKDLVQRLTGRAVPAAVEAAAEPYRPRPCRATPAPQGCSYTTPSAVAAPAGSHGRLPTCQLEELNDMADFSQLFYFGGSESRRGAHNGGYNDFPY